MRYISFFGVIVSSFMLAVSISAQSFQEDLARHLESLNTPSEVAYKIDYQQIGKLPDQSFSQSYEMVQKGQNFVTESPNGIIIKQDSVLLYVDNYNRQVILTTSAYDQDKTSDKLSTTIAINAKIEYSLIEETSAVRTYQGKDPQGNLVRARFDKTETRFSESEIIYSQQQPTGIASIKMSATLLRGSSLPWIEDIVEVGSTGLQLKPTYNSYHLTGS